MSKMYCIFSREGIEKMQFNVGKMASQAGHAYLHAWWDLEENLYKDNEPGTGNPYHRLWFHYRFGPDGATKICLVVDTDAELVTLYEAYKGKTGTTLVVDEGRTVFNFVPTQTAVGIGPLSQEMIEDDLKSLKKLGKLEDLYGKPSHC